jgi:probable HAF family extracellular repeat protein
MKTHAFTFVALFALALMAEPALAQSTANSQKSTNLADHIFARLHLDSGAEMANSQHPARDAVALGLAKAKVYKFASADYPGAGTSLVFDENITTILGDTSVVGTSGFTLKGGTYQLLSVPGSIATEGTGINTGGQIVGIYEDASTVDHGFLDTAGVITNIDDPVAAAGTTQVIGINDSAELVGGYEDGAFVSHAFWTTDGVTFNNFDFPGATSTTAADVNTAGDIVGIWTDSSSNTHSFLLHGGLFTSFDFPLAKSTSAIGVNDSGEIAGAFTDASGVQHGFIYAGGSFTQVDVSGAASTALTRIKNNGHLSGFYTDSSGESHGC